MKILFILPEYYPHSGGGISTYYINYINALSKYDVIVKTIIGSGYFHSNLQALNNDIETEVLRTDIFDKYMQKFNKFNLFPEYQRNLASAWAMWEQMNYGLDYDIIECTDFGLGYIPWIINHNKPVVTRLHGSHGQIENMEPSLKEGPYGDINRFTELVLLKESDALITYSEANAAFWRQTLNKDVKMIYPIFNKAHQTVVNKENFGIVCGRIQEWKGPDELCKAVEILGNSDVFIKWYGRDTTLDNKQSKSESLLTHYPNVWQKKIVPQKPLKYEEIQIIQKKAKYAIIPSTWDVFNFTCIEYLFNGTVVICSDGAGASELITHGVNGFKYPKNDIEALSKCIDTILSMSSENYNKILNETNKTLDVLLNDKNNINSNLIEYQYCLKNFQIKKRNDFLHKIFHPSNDDDGLKSVMDKKSLKYLISYITKRLISKFL